MLLIAACLTKEACAALIAKAHALGMEVLLEMHSEQELEYATLGPDLCGINNRNLGSFHTDVETSFRLAESLRSICGYAAAVSDAAPSATAVPGTAPSGPVLVSESGISNPQTVRDLRAAGFRGFLIGETFMKTPHPGQALATFISQL